MCHMMVGGVTRCENGLSDLMCRVTMDGVTRCVMRQ